MDIISLINEKCSRYCAYTGKIPNVLYLSPVAREQLLREINAPVIPYMELTHFRDLAVRKYQSKDFVVGVGYVKAS